ncbi:hypothetical protein [uncultured Shewanella sp.]|uniref:hypothetical protein n=1 Tax=uncultured Shewanella sp. TaxID=173975 RepID=UPI00261943F8|nr:hypothetical protein [uncultured Shewanella sp.]
MMRFLIIMVILSLSGCAQIRQDSMAQHCNQQSAYSQGVNDARQNVAMQPNYAKGCPNTPEQLNHAYRQGYKFAIAHQASKSNINTFETPQAYRCHDQYGQKICGYDCKSFAGQWTCAQKADQKCIQNMSEIKCGYHCQKDDLGQLSCEAEP